MINNTSFVPFNFELYSKEIVEIIKNVINNMIYFLISATVQFYSIEPIKQIISIINTK